MRDPPMMACQHRGDRGRRGHRIPGGPPDSLRNLNQRHRGDCGKQRSNAKLRQQLEAQARPARPTSNQDAEPRTRPDGNTASATTSTS